MPQQTNGFDCGVYTVLFATILADLINKDTREQLHSLVQQEGEKKKGAIANEVYERIFPDTVTQFRQNCIIDIQDLSSVYLANKKK